MSDESRRRRFAQEDLPDGPALQVADCVRSRSLAEGPDGIYFLGCAPDGREAPLYRHDAKTILFVKTVDRDADLMLIESFR